MRKIFVSAVLLIAAAANAQKTIYIPQFLQNTATVEGAQFSMSRTAQSDNFIVIWGNAVGADPAAYVGDLHFDPATILSTMEYIYGQFKTLGFLDDSDGTALHQYKIPIIMLNTWGDAGLQGWAFGGDADGVIGAFWAHPLSMQTGHVAAHEFTHSLQAEAVIDYRSVNGLGPVWNHSGIFWETHANFMRNILYPEDVTAWGMDEYHVETLGDWKNTYENYEFLFAIKESDGIDMVNRLWRESLSDEYPLQAYKRLGGYDQTTFNNKMFDYARRMPTADFEAIGSYLRQYRNNDLQNFLPSVQALYTILQQNATTPSNYEVPVEIAPEEYGYNIVPIYPDAGECAVIIKFKGHTDLQPHAGWRYGFVAAHPDGTISRYSPTYSADSSEITFALEGDETKMYFVVMGAPHDSIQTNPLNDTWHGYPKHFRYPYAISIANGVPEGFQAPAQFRSQLKVGGHLHSNGGGFIQNSASVSASVYVAPAAMVLGNSTITGNVRIDNTALVRNATLTANASVRNNAFVDGGSYSGDASIIGQAFAENVTASELARIDMRAKVTNYHLSGNIEVGGDVVVYNESGTCNNGVYYKLTNYYEDNLLECDGRTATHPDNLDVNQPYSNFSAAQMSILCTCATLPNCLTLQTDAFDSRRTIFIHPNPAEDMMQIKLENENVAKEIIIYNALGSEVMRISPYSDDRAINVSELSTGMYFVKIFDGNGVAATVAHLLKK